MLSYFHSSIFPLVLYKQIDAMFSETHTFSLYIFHNMHKESDRDNIQLASFDGTPCQKLLLEGYLELIENTQQFQLD